MLNRVERDFAQRFGRFVCSEYSFTLIHTHKPLSSRAVDHWRFVSPAMRVAVRDVIRRKQAVVITQRVDDLRAGFPNVEPAKQRQRFFIAAIALHWVQNLFDRDAIGHARIKVIHAISRRRMHDACAVIGRGVVGHEDGREAVVAGMHMCEGMFEFDFVEALAHSCGDDLACELVALQTFLHQRFGQHDQAALGIHQSVGKIRVQIHRLVGGNCPSGRRPNHGEGFLV